jgi:hypothetical protein
MDNLSIIGIAVIGFGFITWVRSWYILKEGYSAKGKITGYDNKFVRVAGKLTWMDYPLVSYIDKDRNECSGYVKYAKQGGRFFKIDQEIEIVVYGRKIYYLKSLKIYIPILAVGITIYMLDFVF